MRMPLIMTEEMLLVWPWLFLIPDSCRPLAVSVHTCLLSSYVSALVNPSPFLAYFRLLAVSVPSFVPSSFMPAVMRTVTSCIAWHSMLTTAEYSIA